jgi:hypothetical protein
VIHHIGVCYAEKKSKKATIDYETLFRSEPKKSEDEWFCGLSALMLEDDPSAPPKALPGGRQGPQHAAAAPAATV